MGAAEKLDELPPAPASNRTMSVAARQYIARRARAELCKRSIYQLLIQSWHVLEGAVPFEDNWHIAVFCNHVQAMLEGWLVANGYGTKAMRDRQRAWWAQNGLEYVQGELLVQNMVLNLPPITLKSRILMVIAPAWLWLHAPSASFACISAVDDNVKRDSNAHRDLITSPWYVDTFLRNEKGEVSWQSQDTYTQLGESKVTASRGLLLDGVAANENVEMVLVRNEKTKEPEWKPRSDIDAVGEWMTTAGGERKSRTMLGRWTGVHVDIQLLDDPDDAHGVHSEPKRKEVQGKWRDAIKNRIKHPDRSIRIAIQQRVHIDDWTSAQIAKGLWSPQTRKSWVWIVLPLQYGAQPENAPTSSPWFTSIDPRTVANDNMQPKRFSEAFIADEEIDKGVEGFAGQYNQNPRAWDSGMIKRHMVRYFRVVDDLEDYPRPRPLGTGIDEGTGLQVPAFILGRDVDTGKLDLDWITVSVDPSNGSEQLTASAVGITIWGGKGQRRFWLDDRTAIMSIDTMYAEVKQAIIDWRAGTVLIEHAAAGASVIAELNRTIADGTLLDSDGNMILCVVEDIPTGRDSKEGRAVAMLPYWRQGLVYVREGAPWLYPTMARGRVLDEGAIGEVTSFPKSKRKDRVDTISQLITFYRTWTSTRAAAGAKW